MASHSPPPVAALDPRSTPKQERSRHRQQLLLDAAEIMVAETGLEGLSVREIGRRTGIPIASVYHYFPSAAAMMRALALRQFADVERLIEARLEEAGGLLSDLARAPLVASAVIDDLARYLDERPGAAAVWAALRSHPELRAAALADEIHKARSLTPVVAPMLHESRTVTAEHLALVIMETISANLMYARELGVDHQRLHVSALKLFIEAGLRELSVARR
nr:TetR/AcrR family transcriptional regulator [Sphingomonas liriopis]